MQTTLLRCDNVVVTLPGVEKVILDDISWLCAKGSHCAFVGENGSGKSTLLRLFAGFLWPKSGTISWLGHHGGMDSSLLAGRAISSLVSPAEQVRYQRNAWSISGLDLVLTGFEDTVFLSGREKNQSEKTIAVRKLANTLLCEDLLYRDISELSQGQLRILLICRALCKQPSLLLLDECTDGLDKEHVHALLDVLDAVAETTTILFVTHTMQLIPSFCREICTVKDGQLSAKEIRSDEWFKVPLNNSSPHKADQSDRESASSLSSEQSGTEKASVEESPAHGHTIQYECVLETEKTPVEELPVLFALNNASVYLNRKKILRDISLSIHQGEHWLIIGANGSGKSTFLRLLANDVFCAAGGEIVRWLPGLNGGKGGYVESLDQIRRGISLVSPMTEVNYEYPVTAHELVCSGFENTVGLYRDYSEMEQHKARELARFFFPECDDYVFERLLTTPVFLLSTGQIRRLFLARALVCDPDVLLLDEPLSGLDPASQKHFVSLLDALVCEKKKPTIVLVSHATEPLPSVIKRVGKMADGCFTEFSSLE